MIRHRKNSYNKEHESLISKVLLQLELIWLLGFKTVISKLTAVRRARIIIVLAEIGLHLKFVVRAIVCLQVC